MRYTIKERIVSGRGGGPDIKEFIVWDTKYNCSYSSINHEESAIKLKDKLNKLEVANGKQVKKARLP